MTKPCCSCKRILDLEQFHKSKANRDGRNTKCKECNRREALARYHANKDEINEKRAATRLADLEKHRAAGRANYRRHAEQFREYRAARKPENAAYMRARRAADPQALRDYEKQWRLKNPGKAKLKWKLRRARRKQACIVPMSDAARHARLTLYGMRCAYCGKACKFDLPPGHPELATEDHLIPLTKGGLDCGANLRLACFPCNASKQAKTAGEFMPEKFSGRRGVQVLIAVQADADGGA